MKKQCPSCEETLPLKNFARKASAPDGLQYECRFCRKVFSKSQAADEQNKKKRKKWSQDYRQRHRAELKAKYKANPATYRKYRQTYYRKHVAEIRERSTGVLAAKKQREWRSKIRERVAAWGKKQRQRDALQCKARLAIRNELRAGRLQKQPCEKCGAKAEAHHDNYSKPLEVRWLCRKHHAEHHRRVV